VVEPTPQYVDAWTQIHTNGVIYVDEDGVHVLHTRKNGVPVDVDISESPLSNKTYAVDTLGASNIVEQLTDDSATKADLGLPAKASPHRVQRRLWLKAKELIDNRMDTINTNNLVTTAQGRFTVFSATMEQVKGGIATVKGTARWRGVTVDATVSNSCTFQVWTAQNAKAGVETNNWTITLWK
jgi:hypothetical protein